MSPQSSPRATGPDRVGGAAGPWLALGTGAVGAAVLAATDTLTEVVPACPLRAVTGFDCPACGLTRGLLQLLRGDPLAALDHNVLLAVVVPLAAWAWLSWAGAPVPRPRRLAGGRATTMVLAFLVAFALVRNLPLPGARWLASGA